MQASMTDPVWKKIAAIDAAPWILALLGFSLFPLVLGPYWLNSAIIGLFYVMMASSWNLLAGFSGSYDSRRQNLDPNGAAAPRSDADFSSRGATIGAKLYKSFATSETITLTPSLGLTYTRFTQDKIEEKNGGASYDYRIDKTDAEAIVLGIGLDTGYLIRQGPTPLVADFRTVHERTP